MTFTHHTAGKTAVSCRGLTKEFGSGNGRVMALRGIDIDIQLGELTLLVGPSGCGKTTLLSVVAGILEQTAGTVSVLGVELSKLSSRQVVAFRGKNIGFVFQQYNLLPALTAAENVAVPGIISGMSRREATARGMEMLARFGLGDRGNAMPHNLSGGQQQRVAIARALAHEPKLLVCDEPTSALDAENGRLTMDLLHEIATQPDRSVIVVTHDNRVFDYGDRVAYMDDGRIERVDAKSSHSPAPALSGH